MIDLHTHTTASDGRCTPAELVARARVAGVTILAVTDHDTVGACELSAAACRDAGIEFVPGIEITATLDEVDVHVLGYFIRLDDGPLLAALARLQEHRAVLRSFHVGDDADEIVANVAVADRAAHCPCRRL